MKVQKFYLNCLSHASYILESNGEAVVIDPQRDVDSYLEYIDQKGLKLKYVFETHLHADFISGHIELASKSNSQIVIGKQANALFDHIGVSEGDTLYVGNVEIKVLETPGHTPEGICYVTKNLEDHDQELYVFTGDTLFAGDVGRPDLMDDSIPAEKLAELLYFSLRDKLMKLPDNTKVYPAHGAGSSCGKALEDVEYTTIGEQKQTNYALQPMSIEQFVKEVIEDQPQPPRYFLLSSQINRQGAPEIEKVLKNLVKLKINEFEELIYNDDYILLDVRDEDDYAHAHIPNAVHIGLEGRYAEWVGSLLDESKSIILVAPEGREQEAALRCTRVGFDKVFGYLDGGMDIWISAGKETNSFSRIQPEMFNQDILSQYTVVDIRRPTERAMNRIVDSIHIPLNELETKVRSLNNSKPILIHCAGGYRSVIASSILIRNGIKNITDLKGGINQLIDNRNPVIRY
jgi:hydroxyacylglutathione hydrolase